MKHIFLAAILLLTVTLFSCRKENITVPNQNSSELAVNTDIGKPILPPTTYMHIGSFVMNGKDETIHYNLYDFEESKNLITATSGLFTVYGKWYRSEDLQNILIFFDVSAVPDIIAYYFTNLNSEKWVIVNENSKTIYLECDDDKIHKELSFDIIK